MVGKMVGGESDFKIDDNERSFLASFHILFIIKGTKEAAEITLEFFIFSLFCGRGGTILIWKIMSR